jgi:hypothetical protein
MVPLVAPVQALEDEKGAAIVRQFFLRLIITGRKGNNDYNPVLRLGAKTLLT